MMPTSPQTAAAADSLGPVEVGVASAERGPWERYGWLLGAVWLVFLVFPIMQLLDSSANLGWRAIGWVAIVLFAALFVAGMAVGMRTGWGSVSRPVVIIFGAMIICQIMTVPAIGWGALGLLPFLMSYASYGMRGWWHWAVWGASIGIAALSAAVQGFERASVTILGIVLLIGVVNTVNTWLIGRSVRAEQLRVDLATSHEREAVARDVHDLIGHSLTVVKLKAELAERLIDLDPDRAKAEVADIAALAGEAITGVRSTVTGLRASSFDEQLAASTAALEMAGLTVDLRGSAEVLSPAQSLTAAWILREATTNVLRHARAEHVVISISPGSVEVADDGIGGVSTQGNGVRGMSERAAAAGAEFTIDVVPSGGTRAQVRW